MAKEYNISKSVGVCGACKQEMAVDQEFFATVREAGDEFQRVDYCLACWQANPRDKNDKDVLGVWQSRIGPVEEKKKVFVDNELLVNFLQRLEGTQEPAKINFRFVLALVLMRKKLLVYDRAQKGQGPDTWLMHFKGSDQVLHVIDPHMDDEKIAEVSQNLGQILQGDL